jgi:hypothetical protein
MEVFAVTVFVSLLFGILFAVLFVAERSQRPGRSLEQEALLPLDDHGIVNPALIAGASGSQSHPGGAGGNGPTFNS